MLSTHIVIAEVAKPQGVRGELKLRPITQDIYRFDGLKKIYLKQGKEYVPVKIKVNRIAEDAVYVNFDGVTDRNEAEKYRAQLVYIDRAHAIELDEDSDFICDLIGLTGVDTEGNSLGKLADVLQPGGNDVYVFKKGRTELLVPALRSVVVRVDYENGQMILDAKRLSEVSVTNEN